MFSNELIISKNETKKLRQNWQQNDDFVSVCINKEAIAQERESENHVLI